MSPHFSDISLGLMATAALGAAAAGVSKNIPDFSPRSNWTDQTQSGHDALRLYLKKSIQTNQEARSFSGWLESGYGPAEIVRFASTHPDGQTRLCDALGDLQGTEAQLFEAATRARGWQCSVFERASHLPLGTGRLSRSSTASLEVAAEVPWMPGQFALSFRLESPLAAVQKPLWKVLQILRRQGVRATFFWDPGESAPASDLHLIRQIRSLGHTIGVHLPTGTRPTGLEHQLRVLDRARTELSTALGVVLPRTVPVFFSLGLGRKSWMEPLLAEAKGRGWVGIFPALDAGDWKATAASQQHQQLLSRMEKKKSGVIHFHLMHASSPHRVQTVLGALAQNASWTTVTLEAGSLRPELAAAWSRDSKHSREF